MHVCLSSELSLFLKVFVHVARWDVCAQFICVCGGYFWTVVHLCVCVCVLSCHWHDRRERWFSLAVVASESAREPTGSKWYSLVLNGRVGRPALLQPPVSCYIMTWRWRGTTLLQREERERGRGGGTGRAGWGVAVAQLRSFKVIIQKFLATHCWRIVRRNLNTLHLNFYSFCLFSCLHFVCFEMLF